LASCDGESNSVLTGNSCTVPTATLLAAPFNLPWGSTIHAKVLATNVVGSSDYSEIGSGAVILTNPDAPTLLKNEPAVT